MVYEYLKRLGEVSYRPNGIMMAVFCWSSGVIRMWRMVDVDHREDGAAMESMRKVLDMGHGVSV